MPRLPFAHSFFAALVLGAALLVACGRSDLDPDPGTGSTGTGTCASNADCPTGQVCDAITQKCAPQPQCGPGSASGIPCTTPCGDTSSDPNNCGACGYACPFGEPCSGGVCQGTTSCTNGSCPGLCCGLYCVDTTSDPNNCGGCGFGCQPGATCQNGTCVSITCPCQGGATCCSASCVDTASDANNCGGCGNACPPTSPCILSVCQPGTCSSTHPCQGAGLSCCFGACGDPQTDPLNCGGCGVVCGGGSSCVGGVCTTVTGCQGGPACAPGESCCASGCADVLTDGANCGQCGITCSAGSSCVGGVCTTVTGCQGGPACAPGESCCASGCADLQTDGANCGKCGIECGSTAACVHGTCAANEGAFDPNVNPTYLAPGVHKYTTITVPAGVTVYVAGAGAASGTLDLNATGDILIDGTIDVSGGPGTQNTITSQSTRSGRAGSGGFTGEPYASAPLSSACEFVAGNPGSLGDAVSGTPGNCTVAPTDSCGVQTTAWALLFTAPVAAYGGGGGVFTGYRAYGSGGGGPAGGGPGGLGPAFTGESDCSGVSAGGGALSGQGGAAGGAPYDGSPGAQGQTQCVGTSGFPAAYVGGGGGGSIGAAALADLAVATSFVTGLSGGGGSADYLNRPVFGGTSGGGGGGGALRLSTPATLVVNGQLLANGGIGGDAVIGTPGPNCDPQPGAGGGGGSGGIIYLAAPNLTIGAGATVSAAGGAGGAGSEFATGGGGGNGGLGRVRLSASPGACTLAGAITPPVASGCAATPGGVHGFAYVGIYPN